MFRKEMEAYGNLRMINDKRWHVIFFRNKLDVYSDITCYICNIISLREGGTPDKKEGFAHSVPVSLSLFSLKKVHSLSFSRTLMVLSRN